MQSRTDNLRSLTEAFGYDNLNRLTRIGDKTLEYAGNGNLLRMPNVGKLQYSNPDKPYAVTDLVCDVTRKSECELYIEYNSFHAPSLMTKDGLASEFIYDASGNRVVMSTGDAKKFYLDEYETDNDGGLQVLYIGGDAYSAPMAYVKRIMSPSWALVNICRDHQGSITHIANKQGRLLREYSYDAWGNMRNPNTQSAYPEGYREDLYLGRGYTGHEHLTEYGLINMNARLYDPETGRFLSPDPYVQMPDNTQSYNRYSYCLNNPLKYVDKDGRLFWMIPVAIGMVVGGYVGASIYSGTAAFWKWKGGAWKGAIPGLILGGTLGYYTSAFISASGMTIGAGPKVVSNTLAVMLKGGSADIVMNAIANGRFENSWKAGLVGMATNVFSKITLGVGPINLTLGKGQKLLQLGNNIENIGMNAFGLINVIAGGAMRFDANNLSFVYTGGIIDKMYAPYKGENASGFSPFTITGNSDLNLDYDTYKHELHHLWHSRAMNRRYFINYGLNGLDAILQKHDFLREYNNFESIAYGNNWW